MFKSRTILILFITLILAVVFLVVFHHQPSTAAGRRPISEIDDHPALAAAIQIIMLPSDTREFLGSSQDISQSQEGGARSAKSYYFERGLGTLVSYHGELLLITHDHWSALDDIGTVQFLNAAGDPLLDLDGGTIKNLIRYQDSGTMILGRPIGGDRSDYLSALVNISQYKYNHRIVPVEFANDEPVYPGASLFAVRRTRDGSDGVELLAVSVETIGERWGRLVYQLRSTPGGDFKPGDSGGGLWSGSRLVGNLWKSDFDYDWNWDSLSLEKDWAETSYAAGLPELGEQFFQSLGTVNPNVEIQEKTSSGEF